MAIPGIPNWLIADSNGSIKLITCTESSGELKEPTLKYTLEAQKLSTLTANPIQRLAVGTHAGQNMVAIASADATFICDQEKLNEGVLSQVSQWNEPSNRFKTEDSWVGLDICSRGIFQCTQRGKARFTSLNSDGEDVTSSTCNVPINLRHSKATPSGMQFAYAGTEVNLSVWDTEVAFQLGGSQAAVPPAPSSGKRARSTDQLFPGEIWRAKNVSNDSLDLRQPINITSLSFLSKNDTGAHHNIAVGNTLGCVHRYDTRRGKKPASSWTDSRMSGGISLVEKGIREHELLIADCGTQLWTIDMRKTSEPLYAYKGLSGKVTSMATSPSTEFSIAGSLDRYVRLLSEPFGASGNVIGKLYVTSAPTAIISIGVSLKPIQSAEEQEEPVEDEDWGEIQQVSSDEDIAPQVRKKRRRD